MRLHAAIATQLQNSSSGCGGSPVLTCTAGCSPIPTRPGPANGIWSWSTLGSTGSATTAADRDPRDAASAGSQGSPRQEHYLMDRTLSASMTHMPRPYVEM